MASDINIDIYNKMKTLMHSDQVQTAFGLAHNTKAYRSAFNYIIAMNPHNKKMVQQVAEMCTFSNINRKVFPTCNQETICIILRYYTDNLHELFQPPSTFPKLHSSLSLWEEGFTPDSCFKRDRNGHGYKGHKIIFTFMIHCSTEVWISFVSACVATYSTDWLHLINCILECFNVHKLNVDSDPYLTQFMDNLMAVCNFDNTSILYHVFQTVTQMLHQFPLSLFHWFVSNRTCVLDIKTKYSKVDPIAELDVKYKTIRNALREEDSLPDDICDLIINIL